MRFDTKIPADLPEYQEKRDGKFDFSIFCPILSERVIELPTFPFYVPTRRLL
jgi:hypothetical protein